MERLYSGLADCYRQTKQTRDQIKASKEQYKYAPDKHILLYNLAFLSDKIEDTKATEHYLQAFLRTKSKQNAVLQQPDDDEEEPAPYIDYYKSATNKLESIRKEKFLKGEKWIDRIDASFRTIHHWVQTEFHRGRIMENKFEDVR